MYPVLLDIAGKSCVVIGGGNVAERKVKVLLEDRAQVRIVSLEVTDELASLAGQGTIEWRKKSYTDDDLDGATLVFAATNDSKVQKMICQRAEENGQLLNVADDPASCSFHVPAALRRGDLTLSVSTNGKSPAVAALVKKQLEKDFGPEYDVLLQIMSQVRKISSSGERKNLSQPERKKIYNKILHNDIISWIRAGQIEKLQGHLKDVMGPDAKLDVNLSKLDV